MTSVDWGPKEIWELASLRTKTRSDFVGGLIIATSFRSLRRTHSPSGGLWYFLRREHRVRRLFGQLGRGSVRQCTFRRGQRFLIQVKYLPKLTTFVGLRQPKGEFGVSLTKNKYVHCLHRLQATVQRSEKLPASGYVLDLERQ